MSKVDRAKLEPFLEAYRSVLLERQMAEPRVPGLNLFNSAEDPFARLYEVGLARELRANPYHGVPTDTIAEHSPQSKWARQLIPGFKEANDIGSEPAIRVSTKEAAAITDAETLTPVPASARDALAVKLRILRKLTKAPASALLELLKLSEDLHPSDYRPLHRE
jgi:hypothetical protein